MRRLFLLVMVSFLNVCLLGCFSFSKKPRVEPKYIIPDAVESENYERPIKSNIRGQYILAPSDVIEIKVRGHQDLETTAQIRPDGRVTMHLIDDIMVSGLTPVQVDDLITEQLKQYLKNVDVSVSVLGFYSKKVHFVGPTGNAIQLPYTGDMTVLDLISRTGGLSQISAPEKTIIVRGDINQPEIIKVNLKNIIYGGDFKDNILLRENDIVILPANFFSKISLVVDNLVRGVGAPGRAISSITGNMSAIDSLDTNLHEWNTDMPLDTNVGGRNIFDTGN